MYYVYILKSHKDGSLYKGQTKDLSERLKQHNNSKTKSTKNKAPWVIIYYEKYNSLLQALKREKYFKSAAGRRWICKNVKGKGSPPD
jgi:putative endonuclease